MFSTRIGLGCMGFSQAYGPADDDQSILTIRAALDHGVRLLDTAMSYGGGHNEELVGRAVAGRRDDAVLATKFGIVRGPEGVRLDAHPDRVRDYCDASLRRLGVDVIDLYYLHRADPTVPIEDTVGAMAALVTAGKVRQLGLSEVSPAQFAAARAVHPIAAVQLEWSLAWREPEGDIIPAARAGGAGIVAYSPLGRGLLTGALPPEPFGPGDFRAGDPRFAGETLAANLAVVDAVRSKAAAYGVSTGQLALAWLLARGDDVLPIPGTRNPSRIVENAAAADLVLTPDDLAFLDGLAWQGDRRSFAAYGTSRSA
ncbi:aryl-alcohol dehydrogenase-like predicted oxidoreductase [Actinoplanes octamycinicus]|uniref:Aryl-alcohol dehydrogenase-like predicted oxidoreductase n=1 Tax=Actinoplanes octamycinicus TaxID=135948 RepID=A0A7W7M893_9ACTN|nr:aldo/keto reductase [Actinoplanes octamycinicus]MBB4740702.1 aryl-alcohol dehydrogenase-like predicted oxidoreductase [Actinoplanes octamycinicus]GIE61762.1 oxidoreductase [Actinoplanes octamycinicus]